MNLMLLKSGLFVRGRRVAMACVAGAMVLQGCAIHRFIMEQSTKKDFVGEEIRGTIPLAVAAADQILHERGLKVKTTPLSRGPGGTLLARKVMGYKEENESLKSVGANAAGAVALGFIGVKKQVKTGKVEVLTFEIAAEWDRENYIKALPGVVLVNVWSGACDKNLSGDLTNCDFSEGLDMMTLAHDVESRIAAYQQAHPGVTSTAAAAAAAPAQAPAPAAAAGEAEYQAASAAYAAQNYDEAWRQSYAAVQANPQHWQAWQMIGNCQYAKGDKAGAIASYRSSLQINPGNTALQTFTDQLAAQ